MQAQREQQPETPVELTPEQRRRNYRRTRFTYLFTTAGVGALLGVALIANPLQWLRLYQMAPEGMGVVTIVMGLFMSSVFLGQAYWVWRVSKKLKALLQSYYRE